MSSGSKIGLAVTVISALATTLAILTPYWLQNWTDSTFAKMGLWVTCSPGWDEYRPKYNKAEFWDECSWMFLPREYPWLFLAIQAFFAISWILLIFCTVKTSWLVFCSGTREGESPPVKHVSLVLLCSGFLGAFSLVMFFSMCERWIPKSRDNFISWSFWLGAIGVIGQLGGSLILMMVHSRREVGIRSHNNSRIVKDTMY